MVSAGTRSRSKRRSGCWGPTSCPGSSKWTAAASPGLFCHMHASLSKTWLSEQPISVRIRVLRFRDPPQSVLRLQNSPNISQPWEQRENSYSEVNVQHQSLGRTHWNGLSSRSCQLGQNLRRVQFYEAHWCAGHNWPWGLLSQSVSHSPKSPLECHHLPKKKTNGGFPWIGVPPVIIHFHGIFAF